MLKFLQTAGMMTLLLCFAPVAQASNAGDPCQAKEVGVTKMSEDQVNILACLKSKPGAASPQLWKNFMPDAMAPDGFGARNCVEGVVAIYTGGRYACQSLISGCNDGDLLVYQDGRFVCGNTAKANVLRNRQIFELPVQDVPDSSNAMRPPGESMATVSFTGNELNFLCAWPSHGKLLFSYNYVAQTTGTARLSAVIPVRIHQTSYPMESELGGDTRQFEQTFWAELYVQGPSDDEPQRIMIGDLYNPDGSLSGSTGDVGRFFATFAIEEGKTYKVEFFLRNAGNVGVDYRMWAGTLWPLEDTRATGTVEIEEMAGGQPTPWDFPGW